MTVEDLINDFERVLFDLRNNKVTGELLYKVHISQGGIRFLKKEFKVEVK